MDDDGWETEQDSQRDLYSGSNRMSTYQTTDFPPKPVSSEKYLATRKYFVQCCCPQDLISTEYSVAYGGQYPGYCDTTSSLPQSDSQTSLHSASQLAGAGVIGANNRHSTVLNVSDPRYSAAYGNPYLRSPPKHSQYATYSTFSPSDVAPGAGSGSATYNPVSYIASPASTNTVHSMVSMARPGSVDPPPPPPPSHHFPPNGGSIMGIGVSSNGSPQTGHHRHPVSNDLYAVVSKPNGVMFRNGLNTTSTSSNSPVPTYDHSSGVTSPVTYIMDTNPASHTGTHV